MAVFVPFVTQELFQSGAAMYYGINAKSHNMIMLDRKQARCPNGLKLGTPGSGKSMSCKSDVYKRQVSMSAMYLRIGNTCGGETALPSVFIRLLRFGTSSVLSLIHI